MKSISTMILLSLSILTSCSTNNQKPTSLHKLKLTNTDASVFIERSSDTKELESQNELSANGKFNSAEFENTVQKALSSQKDLTFKVCTNSDKNNCATSKKLFIAFSKMPNNVTGMMRYKNSTIFMYLDENYRKIALNNKDSNQQLALLVQHELGHSLLIK